MTCTMINTLIETVGHTDPEVGRLMGLELERQQDHAELIASENYTSKAVLAAQGSILTNKYAEGYPGRRYYGGCMHVDGIEALAIDRAKALFGCDYVNVQPHSGSQANQAVYLALLKPGDTVLGMDLNAGGHLTHGCRVNLSGKWFNFVSYGVRETDFEIDFDHLEKMAQAHKPKMIIAGYSAYTRHLDFRRFREIADRVGAYLMVDMAHFAGLVAAGLHESPMPYADVVTSTTHKTLRGPRGGIILSHNPDLFKKFNAAVFPGLQGGPLLHVIAGKAVMLKEDATPAFKDYIQAVIHNTRTLGHVLMDRGYDLIGKGTDNHLILVDLRAKDLKGNVAEKMLERCGLTVNKNAIPFDETSPMITSGLRIGGAAMTTRGMGVEAFTQLGHFIADTLDALGAQGEAGMAEFVPAMAQKVHALCRQYPLYGA